MKLIQSGDALSIPRDRGLSVRELHMDLFVLNRSLLLRVMALDKDSETLHESYLDVRHGHSVFPPVKEGGWIWRILAHSLECKAETCELCEEGRQVLAKKLLNRLKAERGPA